LRAARFLVAWLVATACGLAAGAILAGAAFGKALFPFHAGGEAAALVAAFARATAPAGVVAGVAAGLLAAAFGRSLRGATGFGFALALVTGGFVYATRAFAPIAAPAAVAAVPLPPLAASIPPADAPDLVLVTIDTLRADHLGFAGHARATSPFLDRLAAGGVVFETAIAQGSATRESMASLMTGLQPWSPAFVHRRAAANAPYLADGFHTLAERLHAAGYDTAGFVSNPHLRRSGGHAQGFAHWDEASGFAEVPGQTQGADAVVGAAIAWLARARSPFFLWVHVMDPHHPYTPVRPGPWEDPDDPTFRRFADAWAARDAAAWSERLLDVAKGNALEPGELAFLIGRYDAEIRAVDAAIERLVAALGGLAAIDAGRVLAITADHGEEFLEHGALLHSHTLHDELLRVPLVLRGRGIPAGVRIAAQVPLLDVAPTLLTLAGAPMEGLDGRSLAELWSGDDSAARPAVAIRDAKYVALRAQDAKLVVRTEPYVDPPLGRDLASLRALTRFVADTPARHKIGFHRLDADPDERVDRIGSDPRARELHAELEALRRAHPPRDVAPPSAPGPDAATREQLRALGYAE
jgi:arylsulfatase